MSDPLSAMMNFISDVNPLASVFKSPDGASPDASPARDTRKSLKISPLTPSSLANRQASRALRRRPAGFRPGPPRAGERGVAVRHPQPPQRGVAARHRQREGDATARRCEGSCPFHLVAFPRPSVAFQRGPRLDAARRRRDPGAVRPETARTRARSRRSRAARVGGSLPARAIGRRGGCPPSFHRHRHLSRHFDARSDARLVSWQKSQLRAQSRFCENASWHEPRALFFRFYSSSRRDRAIATARTASDRPLRSIIFVNFKHDADQRRVFVRRAVCTSSPRMTSSRTKTAWWASSPTPSPTARAACCA